MIERVARALAPGFVFGNFGVEDIEQEARRMGLDALHRYDRSRPLDSFLFAHVRNRLINFKRDNYHRADPPCKVCERAWPGPTAHEGGNYCEEFLAWKERNHAKQALARPLRLEPGVMHRYFSEPSRVSDQVETQELLEKIDQELPLELRADYLRMTDGVSLPAVRRERVRSCLTVILSGWLALPGW